MFQAPYKSRRVLCKPPSHYDVVTGDNAHQHEGFAKFQAASKDNRSRLAIAWRKVADEITRLGHELLIPELDPRTPDELFRADGSVHFIDAHERHCVRLSNMNSPSRQLEVIADEKLFRNKNYIIYQADKNYKHEGTGDSLFASDLGVIFMGYGPRSDRDSGKSLAATTGKTVFALPLMADFIDDKNIGDAGGLRSEDVEGFHLDVLFQPLPTGHALCYWQGLPYPAQNMIGLLYDNLFNEETRKWYSNIIKISEHDYNKFATNCLAVPNKDAPNGYTLFIPEDISQELKDTLSGMGYRLFEVDIEVARWSGGGLHCMFNVEYDFSTPPSRKLNYVDEHIINRWGNPYHERNRDKRRYAPGVHVFRPNQSTTSTADGTIIPTP